MKKKKLKLDIQKSTLRELPAESPKKIVGGSTNLATVHCFAMSGGHQGGSGIC